MITGLELINMLRITTGMKWNTKFSNSVTSCIRYNIWCASIQEDC